MPNVRNGTEELRALGKIKQTVVKFTFAPKGSSAIDQTSVKGWASSVSYVSTGLYRVKMGTRIIPVKRGRKRGR